MHRQAELPPGLPSGDCHSRRMRKVCCEGFLGPTKLSILEDREFGALS
jgi:hypothetical protein